MSKNNSTESRSSKLLVDVDQDRLTARWMYDGQLNWNIGLVRRRVESNKPTNASPMSTQIGCPDSPPHASENGSSHSGTALCAQLARTALVCPQFLLLPFHTPIHSRRFLPANPTYRIRLTWRLWLTCKDPNTPRYPP